MYAIYYMTSVDALGRDAAVGDGITAPSRRLVAVSETVAKAKKEVDRLTANLPHLRAGDGKSHPKKYYVERFSAMDFLSRQDRQNYYPGRALTERVLKDVRRL